VDNSGRFLQPRPEGYFFQRDALQNELQLARVHRHRGGSARAGRQLIGTLFQALVVHGKAIALPEQLCKQKDYVYSFVSKQ
jgi:hypothetical protein